MTTESRSSEERARAERLEAILDRALVDAARWEFDAPNSRAIERVRELLDAFAAAFPSTHPFDVAVAVDGSVEVTAGGKESYVSVTVSSDGTRIDSATINTRSKSVTWEASEPDFGDLVREIERAA